MNQLHFLAHGQRHAGQQGTASLEHTQGSFIGSHSRDVPKECPEVLDTGDDLHACYRRGPGGHALEQYFSLTKVQLQACILAKFLNGGSHGQEKVPKSNLVRARGPQKGVIRIKPNSGLAVQR